MSLSTVAQTLLEDLNSGQKINREQIVGFLKDVATGNSTQPAQADLPMSDKNIPDKIESTPVRTRVSNWNLGVCKRCLENNVENGDIIVKIFGLGWWHDVCYRKVNPKFYDGL